METKPDTRVDIVEDSTGLHKNINAPEIEESIPESENETDEDEDDSSNIIGATFSFPILFVLPQQAKYILKRREIAYHKSLTQIIAESSILDTKVKD